MGVHTLGRAKKENSGYDGWWSDAVTLGTRRLCALHTKPSFVNMFLSISIAFFGFSISLDKEGCHAKFFPNLLVHKTGFSLFLLRVCSPVSFGWHANYKEFLFGSGALTS